MKNLENAGIHPKEINWFFGSRISVDVHKKSHDFFPVSVHNILFYDRGVFTIRVKKSCMIETGTSTANPRKEAEFSSDL